MSQLEHIEAIEKHLWTAADTMRANSNYASNEYFLATMGRGAMNQTELSKDTVAELPFLRPPQLLAEQFEAFAKETAGQIQNLIQQNTSLAQARDLLLPRLVRGG